MGKETKRFDPENHKKNDLLGKSNVKKFYIDKWNIYLKDNKNKYYTDLIGHYDNQQFYVEASMNVDFRIFYKECYIWQRRIKPFQKHLDQNHNLVWCISNAVGTKFLQLRITQDIMDIPQKLSKRKPKTRSFDNGPEYVIPVPKKYYKIYEV